MENDRLIHRLANMLSLGISQEEAHDTLKVEGVSEETFFLCFQAAKLLCPNPSQGKVEVPS